MHYPAINTVITESDRLFKQHILAHTALSFGQGTLAGFPDSVCIKTIMGLNVEIEPIPMGELKHYNEGLPDFLLEIFHGKLVQVWLECLSRLFQVLIDLHFSGKRHFTELKKRNISLDFQEITALEDQVRERLCRDFDFQRYGERVKLINGVFNPSQEEYVNLANIAKNVQIRNSFQHHGGTVDEFLLKELGVQQISLVGTDGRLRDYKLGDAIELSIAEFDAFRRSLLMIGQIWRKWNG